MKKYTVNDILPILENVKEYNGYYMARCPVSSHEDKEDSFKITEGKDGFAVCHCFVCEDQKAIWAAIYDKLGKPENDTPKITKKSKVVATYVYANEAGKIIDTKKRWEPGFSKGKKKDFTWINGTDKRPEPLPLYNLAGIIGASEVYAVEGEKDVNTLQGLGYAATSTKDGFTPDNMKYLKGKQVFIIRDNDSYGKSKGMEAAEVVRPFASSVKVVDLEKFFPALCQKGDITDFIEAGGNMEELRRYIDTLPEAKEHPHAAIYEDLEHYFINDKGQLTFTDGKTITPLCYGSLAITETIYKNDGTEASIFFKVEGITQEGRKLHPVIVSASDFDSLKWISREYGCDIVAAPTQSAEKKLAAGIRLAGKKAPRNDVYTHTGYLMEGGKPIAFLHAGGNIGGSDTLQTSIDNSLNQYKLQGVSASEDERKAAALSSLSLLKAHAPGVVYPLFSFVYLAPLAPVIKETIGDIGFCLFLNGKTQSGKSTLAALAMSHFGRFTATTPPTSFISTANYISELSHILKDSILWIDDFHPQSGKNEENKMNQIFQNIARAAGDHSQRGRLTSSAKLQAIHKPRCLFLVTGELSPRIGQSGIARLFTLNVTKQREDIDELREAAGSGLLSQAMSDYISFIISHYEDVIEGFAARFKKASEKVRSELKEENRLSNQVTLLYASSNMFLTYATLSGILTEEEARKLNRKFWEYIINAAMDNEKNILNQDPAKMYIETIGNLLSSGQRFLIDLNDKDKYNFNIGSDGQVIGWRDSQFIYLDPHAAYKTVVEYYSKEGDYFGYSKTSLHRDLLNNGLLIVEGGKDPTIQKKIGGNNKRVLRFLISTFEDTEEPGLYEV